MKKKVAIFDIDGTIFRSSLLIELLDELIAARILPAEVTRIYKKPFEDWFHRKGSYDNYIAAVVRAFNRHIQGVHVAEFDRVAERVIAQNKNRVYRYTRDLVQELKKKDYYLLAISHSPLAIVRAFAKTLGFSKTYGRIYEVSESTQRFTGKVSYEDLIKDKAKILRRAVKAEDLSLRGSIGVGDSEGDISFLKLVERPICFNPSEKLYRHAKRAGWEIVVERKNMIYHL
jgi:HAD superfamily hydrolase (TIGR01490 family)